jgi:hypothetical protein
MRHFLRSLGACVTSRDRRINPRTLFNSLFVPPVAHLRLTDDASALLCINTRSISHKGLQKMAWGQRKTKTPIIGAMGTTSRPSFFGGRRARQPVLSQRRSGGFFEALFGARKTSNTRSRGFGKKSDPVMPNVLKKKNGITRGRNPTFGQRMAGLKRSISRSFSRRPAPRFGGNGPMRRSNRRPLFGRRRRPIAHVNV